MAAKLLQGRNVTCKKSDNNIIFSKLNFDINEKDIVVLQGKSGSG